MQLGMMVDMHRCIGCKTCVVQCRNEYGLINPESVPGEIPYYLRLETRESGTFPNVKRDYRVTMCQNCTNPACAEGCASGAIQRDARTGIVRMVQSECTGCQNCVGACPYEVIQFDAENNVAHKCNTCFERVTRNLQPVCVDQCMTDALSFGELSLLRMRAEAKGRKVDEEISKEAVLYVNR